MAYLPAEGSGEREQGVSKIGLERLSFTYRRI